MEDVNAVEENVATTSDESYETVILVLGENRIKARKEKLARYSLYFASLFSENYSDHRQKEFTINYQMSVTTLQDFVNWANSEGDHTKVVHSPKYYCVVRESLEKFLSGNYVQLLELLELSVVFLAEKLTDNLIDIIVSLRLRPAKMLDIWLLAENLGLKTLGDLALAVCLDRFNELTMAALVELSIEHFAKLVLNVNVRSSPARLLTAREEWKKRNFSFTDLPDSYSQFLHCDAEDLEPILEQKKPREMQCVTVLSADRGMSIYSWNGKNIQKITEMTDELMHMPFDDNKKEIVGRQFTGRGFSIYVVGGEQGIGTGRFNPALWRYCLFAKKWYVVTLFPVPRRHMAVAFIRNKLYLFGGVGRHRLKLNTVDIYNIHTGLWKKGANIPETFTEVPPSCVVDDKFVYFKTKFHVYNPRTNRWYVPEVSPDGTHLFSNCEFPVRTLHGYENAKNDTVVIVADVLPNRSATLLTRVELAKSGPTGMTKIIHKWKDNRGKSLFFQQIMTGQNIVSFHHDGTHISVEVGEIVNESSADSDESSDQEPEETYRRIKTYTSPDEDPDCEFWVRFGRFEIIDPKTLHDLVSLPKQDSISV